MSSAGEAKTAKRRPAGEPRHRLLLSAAADVFNRKDYSGATTREIAEHANVGENQIFRFFGSKAGLFNEAMVVPFVELVDRHIERRLADPERFDHPRQAARTFIADMYDTFHTHRLCYGALHRGRDEGKWPRRSRSARRGQKADRASGGVRN